MNHGTVQKPRTREPDWLDEPELQGAALMLAIGVWMILEAGRSVVVWVLR